MLLTFKYRLYPTVKQAVALETQMAEACRLYNAALQERRDAWKMQRKRISLRSQDAQLREIRAAGDLSGLPTFDVASNVLRRVDKAFAAFFRRCKSGQAPGYPRFRPAHRFDSLGVDRYRSAFARLKGNRFHWRGVGDIKAKIHRPFTGIPRTVLIKRDAGRWFLVLTCEGDHGRALEPSSDSIGVDVGLSSFVAMSNGETVAAPRHYRKAERRLRVLQRHVCRCKRRSQRQRKARRAVARAHQRVRNLRAEFHHQLSRTIVNRFGVVAVEDLNIAGLARTRLAKSIHDAGWGSFIEKIAYKAESAGRVLVKVDPRGTSQICICGASVPKKLSDRWHLCPECGLSAPRDVVSARIIEQRGRRWQALTGSLDPVVCRGEESPQVTGQETL